MPLETENAGIWRNEFKRARGPIPAGGKVRAIGTQDVTDSSQASTSPGALRSPKFHAHIFHSTACNQFEAPGPGNMRRLHATKKEANFGFLRQGAFGVRSSGNGTHQAD